MPDPNLIYTEYFQTFREYIMMLQNFAVILISAASILIYKFTKNKIVLKFVLLIVIALETGSIITGLYAYKFILEELLKAKISFDSINPLKVGCYMNSQFWLNIAALILIVLFVIPPIFYSEVKDASD